MTQWLLSVWVKAPYLRNADILITSACLPQVNPSLFKKFSKNKVVLLACPEKEGAVHHGKIATIIKCSKLKSITVITVEGSPHCFTLHACVNEALFLVGREIPRKHYTVVNGEQVHEIKPEAIRVARYLHLVDKLVEKYPEILKELNKYSLEYKESIKLGKT